MRDTHHTGNVAVAKISARLLETGRRVLFPFGDGCGYDLIIDDGGMFSRVQCKNGLIRRRSVRFNTSRPGSVTSYSGVADFFGVWCDGVVYMVPVSGVPVGHGILSLADSKPGPKTPMAKDFVV